MSDRSQLRLGVIADIHLAPAGTRATSWHGPIHGAQMRSRLGEALACLEDDAVGAVVLLGDLTEGADRESANSVLLDCAGLRRPTFVVPGNCDLGADGADDVAASGVQPDIVLPDLAALLNMPSKKLVHTKRGSCA